MKRAPYHQFLADESGASAAVIGMSLFALVAIAGVGFDYTRLAAMDSELQNAADQAALAGASQLDGGIGTCMRAAAAATTFVENLSLLANDGNGSKVTIPAEPSCDATGSIRFYRNKEKTQVATSDANAKFIEVSVTARTANYAFTPLAGAFNSGLIGAAAFAGLGSAICKVPPVMMCNPAEDTDFAFNVGNYIGKGMSLIAGQTNAPGNFGFLANDGRGTADLRDVLSHVSPPGDCIETDLVVSEPGKMASVLSAINTRFDIYGAGLGNTCGQNDALCPPAFNTRKDVVKGNGNGKCNVNTWSQPAASGRYLPPSSAPLTATERTALAPMGYPRDMCHAVSSNGNCAALTGNARIGDGEWDRQAYFQSNGYGSSFNPATLFGTSTPSRYNVYKWEIGQQLATTKDSAGPAFPLDPHSAGGNTSSHGKPFCTPPGIIGSSTVPDRRVLPVAVVNCNDQAGRDKFEVVTWIDAFLVEPSIDRDRTDKAQLYIEIVGETQLGGGGGTTANTVRRDVPYLVE